MGPYIRYRHVHDFTHDVDHVRKSPSAFLSAGSKVIRVLIEGEPGNEASALPPTLGHAPQRAQWKFLRSGEKRDQGLLLSEPDGVFGRETGLILQRDPIWVVLRMERLVYFPKTQDVFQESPH